MQPILYFMLSHSLKAVTCHLAFEKIIDLTKKSVFFL